MNSLWSSTVNLEEFPSLNGPLKTDVLIVGGGMAGVLCAHFLQEANIDYALVESKRIGSGITKNTTAKITAQHGLIYDNLIHKASFKYARKYLYANLLALERYEDLAKDIKCDFEKRPSFVYSTDDEDKIKMEVAALKSLRMKTDFCETIPLPLEETIRGAVMMEDQAQFHPLKFISGISKGLRIFENTHVNKIDGNTAETDNGDIEAKYIVIATHFPFIDSKGGYFLKMYQHRSYVIAIEWDGSLPGMYVDESDLGMSFRQHDNMLFIGGGDHRTGKIGGGFEELRDYKVDFFPRYAERYAWATQDCMTLDRVPYIGRYSKSAPHMLVATGFNKWGMTGSMIAAEIIKDIILERKNEYAELFDPSRSMMKLQLLKNSGSALAGMLTPTRKRCSHLGCGLKWNDEEQSWDCPCHGSRFDIDGHVIDNPGNRRTKLE